MKIYNDVIDYRFELPDAPRRVVSLTSGTTEALFAMGCGDRVVGVSEYCSRYVPDLDRPVVGDYLKVDREKLASLKPDLILTTSGIQRSLAVKLAGEGWPVYALSLPGTIYGILDNIVTAGALMNETASARRLVSDLLSRIDAVRAEAPHPRPRVYVELWFGRYSRSIGGRTFIHDIVDAAGGDPIFADRKEGYLDLDLEEALSRTPEVFLGFSEPEHPVDFAALCSKRGWYRGVAPLVVESTIQRGRNIIHDGPSIVETIEWLSRELLKAVPKP